jgi:hypothetical protein
VIVCLTPKTVQHYFSPFREHLIALTSFAAAEVLAALWLLPIAQRPHSVRLTAMELFNCENEARKTLAQIVGGIFLILTFGASVRTFVQQQQAGYRQEEGRINEQYTKAIELLGATLPAAPGRSGEPQVNYAVRIGAIYSLDRVARDYPEKYRLTVVEVLRAYVDSRKSEPSLNGKSGHKQQLSPDVLAANKVIGQ